MSRVIVEAERLRLREFAESDAPFILRVLNDPAFMKFVGDRGIRSVEEAVAYIRHGPMAMYANVGFGLWLVERLEDSTPIGICGLLKRPTLDDVDIGYALVPEYRGGGYALEAARGALDYALTSLGLRRIVAIVSPANQRSIALLEKLGFHLDRIVRLSDHSPESKLFAFGSTMP